MYFVICALASMKKSGTTACVPCTVLITNGKRISMN